MSAKISLSEKLDKISPSVLAPNNKYPEIAVNKYNIMTNVNAKIAMRVNLYRVRALSS